MRLFVVLAAWVALAPAAAALDRPNILWLVCEDASVHWFGCYGNPHAKTPNIDALAESGFRYTHVYANAPVCAPSRSTWITGVYAISNGTHPMRSRYTVPHAATPYYPDQLRKAGYFCANHTKTDYNIGGRADDDCWDSKRKTAWAECKPGQPFFQVVNYNESHESKAQGDVTATRHPPDDVRLAKYHPDLPLIRQNYAKYHDAVATMDDLVGKTLAALDASGRADDTIVVFCSDHGGVLPRSKRFLYDSGVHSPLILRIPEKFKHLRPSAHVGSTVDRLVSFIDMPKTWLAITGAEIPPSMQGTVFLGPTAEPKPPYAYGFRARMDERIDNQRSVRDKRFVYIRNYLPDVPNGQFLDYLWKMRATQAWEAAFRAGTTDETASRFFRPKPPEELYDRVADPDNVVNLAADPGHRETLLTMRAALREWQLKVRDTGMIPESEIVLRAEKQKLTIAELARQEKSYALADTLDAADRAHLATPFDRARAEADLRHKDSGIRYWALLGLIHHNVADKRATDQVRELLNDGSDEVATYAAWHLLRAGEPDRPLIKFRDLLEGHSTAALTVFNVLDWTNQPAEPLHDSMTAFESGRPLTEYEKRMLAYLRAKQ